MKKFRFHPWQIWPLSLGVIFVMFFSLHKNTRLMNAVWWGAVFPLERGLARLTSHTTLSVAEVLIISAGTAAFFGLTYALRRRKMKQFLAIFLCAALTVYAGFCLLWGTAYYADGFQTRSGLTARGGTVAELTELTEYFAQKLSQVSPQVPRDEQGAFAVSRQEILAYADRACENVEREFPFLHASSIVPKAFASSRALSALDFTGFYFPFTGEANVNIDCPPIYLGATICHEMAHQRGYASEQECNFIGILAAATCDNAAYNYAGYLIGYVYLSNALYAQDYDTWLAVRGTLPPEVLLDLHENSRYWAQFEGKAVQKVSNTVYDGFLKANGDEKGIRSYGTVVDLLLSYNWE